MKNERQAGTTADSSTTDEVTTSASLAQNPMLAAVFSVGDKVNYCNGLIFEIVSINYKNGICYDKRGMWYALLNCVKLSANGS